MNKRIAIVVIVMTLVAAGAFAAGGKNQIQHRGDIGVGEVIRHQIMLDR